VILSMPGSYTLSVADRSSGATGAPCSRTLFGQDCAVIDPPQPPPPGPPDPTKCPVPARWWLSNCDKRTAHLDAASSRWLRNVWTSSAVWSYNGRPDGLCELLTPRRHGRPFLSARRQFAAVHANLVAHQMGVTDLSGRAVGLWNGTVLEGIPGIAAGTTLQAWVTATEASLVAMGEGMGRDRAQREECRRIRRQALAINMGSRRNGCSTALDGAMPTTTMRTSTTSCRMVSRRSSRAADRVHSSVAIACAGVSRPRSAMLAGRRGPEWSPRAVWRMAASRPERTSSAGMAATTPAARWSRVPTSSPAVWPRLASHSG
jgi:hypothetical protein